MPLNALPLSTAKDIAFRENKLLWRLCAFIAVGTVLLFWAIAWLTNHTETSMSFIDKAHQETLYSYGQEARKSTWRMENKR